MLLIVVLGLLALIVAKKFLSPPRPVAAPAPAPAAHSAPPAPVPVATPHAPVDPLIGLDVAAGGYMRDSIYRAMGEQKATEWADSMSKAIGKISGNGGAAPKSP